jgi:anhydro-N-acetylmuramic acid kinase
MINYKYWQEGRKCIIGIMTGTSLDGVDLSIVDFDFNKGNIKIISSLDFNYHYPENLRNLAMGIINQKLGIREISELHFSLAELYKAAILSALEHFNLKLELIDAISIHGQTVWHEPKVLNGHSIGNTLQLGSGSALSKLIEKPVVYDFRSADIALGGQGAPLVPIFDYHYFKQFHKSYATLNIGGISNLCYVHDTKITAFDCGVGNILIDLICNKYFQCNYDSNGNLARNGNFNPNLFGALIQDEFINLKPPKSTGREKYNENFLSIYEHHYSKEELITTFTHFTAFTIAKNVSLFCKEIDFLIISGGGLLNNYLIEQLAIYLKEFNLDNIQLKSSEDYNISSNNKEAIIFAYLGYRTLCGLPSNIRSVTGASKEVVLGAVAW